jgi:hypothetical protein
MPVMHPQRRSLAHHQPATSPARTAGDVGRDSAPSLHPQLPILVTSQSVVTPMASSESPGQKEAVQ